MNGNLEEIAKCSDCGLPKGNGGPTCQSLFNEVLAQHFESPAYFGVHRLFVDTYCMQHPDQGCISFKSFAAHAAHLCWSVERGGSRAVPSEAIRRWVEQNSHLEKPPLPPHRGTMTIAEVARLEPSQHQEAVWRWAEDVWADYRSLHDTIRSWVDLARADGSHVAGPPPDRPANKRLQPTAARAANRRTSRRRG
jgi:hypothetical protein